MRKLLAAVVLTAIGTFGSAALPPVVDASHNRMCRKSISAGEFFTTARSRCFRIERHDEMFWTRVVLIRRSDGTRWVLRGERRDCNGQISDVEWIRPLYRLVSHRTIIRPDTLLLGC